MLRRGLPPRTFLNVNVPKGQPKGLRATVQAKRNHVTSVAERHDPKGRPYFWIEEGQNEWQPHDRSDYQAVRDGYVSVTPLQPDLTAHGAIGTLEEIMGLVIWSSSPTLEIWSSGHLVIWWIDLVIDWMPRCPDD